VMRGRRDVAVLCEGTKTEVHALGVDEEEAMLASLDFHGTESH
jgi:hypothetical protein